MIVISKENLVRVSITYKTSPEASAAQWLEPVMTSGGKQPYLFTQCQVQRIKEQSMEIIGGGGSGEGGWLGRAKFMFLVVNSDTVCVCACTTKSNSTVNCETISSTERGGVGKFGVRKWNRSPDTRITMAKLGPALLDKNCINLITFFMITQGHSCSQPPAVPGHALCEGTL